MSSMENMKELRKIEINQFLRNPKKGFFNMCRMTEEEAQYHFDNLQVNDTLLYVNHTNRQVHLYEVRSLLKNDRTKVTVELASKQIVDKGEFLEKNTEHTSNFEMSPSFLMQFVAVLRKDPRKFEIQKEAWGDGYCLTVDGHFEATPTGKIKHFGSKDLTMNFVKALASGSAKHTKISDSVVKNNTNLEINKSLMYEYTEESSGLLPLIDRLKAIVYQTEPVLNRNWQNATLNYQPTFPVDTF